MEVGVSIDHNNHTGRWLSCFRTTFDPCNDETMLVGSMDRAVELFHSVSGKRLHAHSSELLTAVPSLNAMHPHHAASWIVSGTASGRMHLWSRSALD